MTNKTTGKLVTMMFLVNSGGVLTIRDSSEDGSGGNYSN